MKRSTLVSILFCLIVTFVMSPVVQAEYVIVSPPFGTGDSYGIWYDRDGVDPYQAASWGMVNGGNYNTMGMYNVVINYHAMDANTAVMMATINGIQQGFWTNHYATPAPDIYPAGLSFTGNMTQMKVFDWLVGWGTKTGTASFNNITATQGLTTQSYGNVSVTYPQGAFTNRLGNYWDLTGGDLTLSYTANLSGVTGPDDATFFLFSIGLRDDTGGTNAHRGMMGMVVDNSIANNTSLNYNDKFDLQFNDPDHTGGTDETYYNVRTPVPIPAAVWLLGSGLIGLIGIRRRFHK